MIGKICTSLTPFYDVKIKRNSYKARPVLVIGYADSRDYVVLPISRVTRKEHIHPVYDVQILMKQYPNLNLTADSYVRTHKQTIVNAASISGVIADLKTEYVDLFLEILSMREDFNEKLTEMAIS